MRIGYARTNNENGAQAQLEQLHAAGCSRIFLDIVPTRFNPRDQLEASLECLQGGDVLVVSKLFRLAHSPVDLKNVVARVREKQAGLHILDLNIEITADSGHNVFVLIEAIAEFDRERMLAQQRVGIEKAKSEGKYKGRKPTAMEKASEIPKLLREGKRLPEIARLLGISRTSAYRFFHLYRQRTLTTATLTGWSNQPKG